MELYRHMSIVLCVKQVYSYPITGVSEQGPVISYKQTSLVIRASLLTKQGRVAQLVAHLPSEQAVPGLIPSLFKKAGPRSW